MIYVYKHPSKEEYVEVVQSMNDKHEYFDENGLKWERVFNPPNLATQGIRVDPFSSKGFVEKTGRMKGSVGDMMDLSREMSERRKEKTGGVDPVREKFFTDYSKKRRGKLHPKDPKRFKKLSKLGVSIES